MNDIIMHSYSLRNFSREEAFTHTAACGYKGIELQRAHFKEQELDSELPQCLRLANDLGLSIHCVDFTADITNDDEKIRQDSIDLIAKNLRICGTHHIPLMNGFTGFLVADADNWGANGSAIAEEKHFDRVTEALIHLCSIAESSNVTLCLEVHMNTIHDTYGTTARLLNRVQSNRLKANPDPGNTFATSAAEHSPLSLDLISESIGYFHMKNCRKTSEGTYSYDGFLGDGEIDFIPYLEKLQSLNYNGPICVEYVGEGDAKAAVKEDIETLRSWLETIF
jgi:sugar phosphate isomerase/epimerase